MIIRKSSRDLNLKNLDLKIGDDKIERIDANNEGQNFLGLWIDDKLSWKKHINNVNKKLTHGLFLLKQVRQFLPKVALRSLYFALIQTHLSYGILAWGNACESVMKRTVVLQKRAIRYINNTAYNSHTEPLFKRSNILKVNDLYEYSVAQFMYQYEHYLLPSSFAHIFQHQYQVNTTYNTRNTHLMITPTPTTEFVKRLPLFNFPNIRNKWHAILESTHCIANVKRSMMRIMTSKYNSNITCYRNYCIDCSDK